MKEEIARITTISGAVYELPDKSAPQLWEVQMSIAPIASTGCVQLPQGIVTVLHLERESLENAGLIPQKTKIEDRATTALPTETAEDLLLRLLSRCGVYPEGEE